MKILLLRLDGKIPNIALMRIAAHCKASGDDVEYRNAATVQAIQRHLFDNVDCIYASCIFEKSKPIAMELKRIYPSAIVGGTGWDLTTTLEQYGIITKSQDYSIYPAWKQSIGFTQRGCRLKCSFCVVPRKEGSVRDEQSINDLWRGDPWPREIILLDNDFFGQLRWSDRINELINGKFKVSFNQGINARFLTAETASAIASVDYRDDQMKVKRLYTAWDNRRDEDRLFRGLNYLIKYGVKPFHIMVYMLIGYWPGEIEDDWVYREQKLREFGCMAYPMPYVRNQSTVGFQRFAITHYSKHCSWKDFKTAGYRSPFANTSAV